MKQILWINCSNESLDLDDFTETRLYQQKKVEFYACASIYDD